MQVWELLDSGLCIGGIVAVGAWIVKGVREYSKRHRELHDLDDEIKARLREVLAEAKRARDQERQRFVESLRSTEAEVQQLSNKAMALAKDSHRLDALQLAFSRALFWHHRTVRACKKLNESSASAWREEGVLAAALSGISTDRIVDIVKTTRLRKEPDPEARVRDPREVLLQVVLQLEALSFGYQTSVTTAAAVLVGIARDAAADPVSLPADLIIHAQERFKRAIDNWQIVTSEGVEDDRGRGTVA